MKKSSETMMDLGNVEDAQKSQETRDILENILKFILKAFLSLVNFVIQLAGQDTL